MAFLVDPLKQDVTSFGSQKTACDYSICPCALTLTICPYGLYSPVDREIFTGLNRRRAGESGSQPAPVTGAGGRRRRRRRHFEHCCVPVHFHTPVFIRRNNNK